MTHACRRVAGKRRSVAEADFVTERVNEVGLPLSGGVVSNPYKLSCPSS